MSERLYDIPPGQRDELIAQMRMRGYTLEQIGKRVGTSRSGVSRAFERLERDDEEPR